MATIQRTQRVAWIASSIVMMSAPTAWAQVRDVRAFAAGELALTAEVFAAAGLSGSEASIIANRVEALAELQPVLDQIKSRVDEAANRVTAARTRLRVGLTDASARSELTDAEASLRTVRAELSDRRRSVFEAAIEGLPQESAERLRAFRDSCEMRVDFIVPPHFRVVRLEKGEWREVALALVAERRANRVGEPLEGSFAELLEQLRGDMRVATAKSNLDYELETISLVWQ